MKWGEVLGLVFVTIVLVGVAIPTPCFAPSCGLPDAQPYSTLEMISAYLSMPLIWFVIVVWLVALCVWGWRGVRANAQKKR